MKFNSAGLNLIKKYEGLKLKPYLDSGGKATIGYGSTFYSNGYRVDMDDSEITEKTAEKLLQFQIKNIIDHLSYLIKVPLTDNEFSALICLIYNIGLFAFEHSTLLKLLNKNDKENASKEFLKWIYDSHKQNPGLLNRRQAEQQLFIS